MRLAEAVLIRLVARCAQVLLAFHEEIRMVGTVRLVTGLATLLEWFVTVLPFERLPLMTAEASFFRGSTEQRLVVARVGIVTLGTLPFVGQRMQSPPVETEFLLIVAAQTQGGSCFDETECPHEPVRFVAGAAIFLAERLVLDPPLELVEIMAAYALPLL
jgi:hypothetical protein